MDIIRRNSLDNPVKCYVTRTYQTRHGNGPLSNCGLPTDHIKLNPKETNVYNKYQGRFRKSVLDLDLLKHAIEMDGHYGKSINKRLYITCLDQCKEKKIRYTINGTVCNTKFENLSSLSLKLPVDSIHTCDNPKGIGIKKA